MINFPDFYKSIKTIAIVGLSDKPDRPSYRVAEYLISRGFRIIPVNPNIGSFMGIKSYPNLSAVKEKVDVVDIFRQSKYIDGIVDEAIKKGARAVWMQEGIVNETASETARKAGLEVVMNMCMMKEHKKI